MKQTLILFAAVGLVALAGCKNPGYESNQSQVITEPSGAEATNAPTGRDLYQRPYPGPNPAKGQPDMMSPVPFGNPPQ